MLGAKVTIRDAAEHGVTGVAFVTASWPEMAARRGARGRGALTLRVSAYPAISDWRNAAESLRVNGRGDGLLRVYDTATSDWLSAFALPARGTSYALATVDEMVVAVYDTADGGAIQRFTR